MERMRKTIELLGMGFWGLAGGILALYLFGLVMGVFTPDELLGWTIVAVALAALVGWHSHRVHVAIQHRDPELMRSLNQAREKRGF